MGKETTTLLKEKYPDQLPDLIIGLLLSMKNKKGLQQLKEFFTNDQKSEIFTLITQGKTDQEIENFLLDKDLMFLLPTPDLTDDIKKGLEAGKDPADLLKLINEKVTPQVSVSELAVLIAKDLFSKVFKKDKINLDVIKTYSKLLKRVVVCPVDHQAQALVVFEAQGVWFKNKHPKGSIKETFVKLYELGIVSPEGFLFWRDDRKIKSKGKSRALLSVNSWIREIEPKHVIPEGSDYDEGDNGDDEGDIDTYLQNPNQSFFT